jgi:quercetin dioxygenase-like cupin family protein
VLEIHPGDVVWIPPGEKHWHGAGPATMMTHLAMRSPTTAAVRDWLEHVTDAQYAVPPSK